MERYLGLSSRKDRGQPGQAPVSSAEGTPSLFDLARLRLDWTAARRRLEAEAGLIRGEIEAAYFDSPEADRIPEAFARLATVVARMDAGILDRVDAAMGTSPAEGRAAAMRAAETEARDALAFIETDPLSRTWDGNPFLPRAGGIGAIRAVLQRLRDGLSAG